MPNIKASIKDLRKTKKRNTYNRYMRSRVRTAIKNIYVMMDPKSSKDAKNETKQEKTEIASDIRNGMRVFFKSIDKAVIRRVIKKNTAARYKSRLTQKTKSFLGETMDATQGASTKSAKPS